MLKSCVDDAMDYPMAQARDTRQFEEGNRHVEIVNGRIDRRGKP
jgi:hypothetical protein